MRNILYLFFIIFLLHSCGPSGEEKTIENLKEEVIAVHDSTMKQMGDISRLRTKIKEVIDGGVYRDSAALMSAYTALERSHEAMMDWMHGFKSPDQQNIPDKAKIEYLEQEKVKITEIETMTDQAIAGAREILKQNRSPEAQ